MFATGTRAVRAARGKATARTGKAPDGGNLAKLRAAADTSPAVARLAKLQRAADAGVVQRTTSDQVQDWIDSDWKVAHQKFADTARYLGEVNKFDFNDNDELLNRLGSVSSQMAGHAYEFSYHQRKIEKRLKPPEHVFGWWGWKPKPREFQQGAWSRQGGGADVVATRRGGGVSAAQVKAVSSASHSQVNEQIKNAMEQLTGIKGEVPLPGWQRVAKIFVLNPENPFPYTDGQKAMGHDISAHTDVDVDAEFKKRLKGMKNTYWDYVDKISVEFPDIRRTSNGKTINRLTAAVQNAQGKKIAGPVPSPGPAGGAPGKKAYPNGKMTFSRK